MEATATMTTTEWFTRCGDAYRSRTDVKQFHVPALGAPSRMVSFGYGKPYDADLTKGTAKYDYEAACSRCGGAGGSGKWAHTGWTCFECGGSGKGGVKTARLYTADRLAKLNAAQAKRDASRQAKAQAEAEAKAKAAQEAYAAFYAANREVVDGLAGYAEAYAEGRAQEDGFLLDLWRKLEEWGHLTEAQLAAVKTALDRMKARAAAKAASQFVGTIGARLELTLTVEHIIHLEQHDSYLPRYARQFAPASIYLCRDDKGNRVVYKGSSHIASKGETIRVKATVEAHDTYKEENQTKIARPKVLAQ